jgi:hypothetical protein
MFTAALPSSPGARTVTVVERSALAADPLPDPKTLSTFWAAERTAPLVSVGPIVRCEIIKTNPIHGLVKAPAG